MEHWTLSGILLSLLLLSLFLPSLLITFIPLTSKPPVSSWKVLSLPKTSSMVLNAPLKPLNCSPSLFLFAPETKILSVTLKQTSVNSYALKVSCKDL
nr:gene E lysis protein [Escherichia phage G4]